MKINLRFFFPITLTMALLVAAWLQVRPSPGLLSAAENHLDEIQKPAPESGLTKDLEDALARVQPWLDRCGYPALFLVVLVEGAWPDVPDDFITEPKGDYMSMDSLFALNGQVAVVTGGGAGIGRGISEVFAKAGASVVVSDRTQEKAEAVASGIVKAGGRAIGVACDVTNDGDLENLVNEALAAFGKITILVNNAGGGGPKPFDMTMDTFVWAYKLNVFSVFRLCQLCAPHMEAAGGGAILNISSMSAENKNVKMAAYGSSKAAVSHLTRNIAFDLGSKGIRVNAIAPGAIKTDALAKVLTPEIEAGMLKHTPLGRLGEARDIAYAALFFCSPAASWVSGQVLTVSGGGVQELD